MTRMTEGLINITAKKGDEESTGYIDENGSVVTFGREVTEDIVVYANFNDGIEPLIPPSSTMLTTLGVSAPTSLSGVGSNIFGSMKITTEGEENKIHDFLQDEEETKTTSEDKIKEEVEKTKKDKNAK